MIIQKFLIGISWLLIISGVTFICLSFRSPNIKNSTVKLIRFGEIGVIFSLIGGLVFINFFYALQKVPERILNEHLEEKYIKDPSDISLSDSIFKSEKLKG